MFNKISIKWFFVTIADVTIILCILSNISIIDPVSGAFLAPGSGMNRIIIPKA